MTDLASMARRQIQRAVTDMTAGVGDPCSAVYDPLVALAALARLRAAVTHAERDAARRAREHGRTWQDIGEAYGFADRPGLGATPPGERAFLAFAPDLGTGPVATWTCPDCGGTVLDRGPGSGHPADAEQGHGPGCERLGRLVAAWEEYEHG